MGISEGFGCHFRKIFTNLPSCHSYHFVCTSFGPCHWCMENRANPNLEFSKVQWVSGDRNHGRDGGKIPIENNGNIYHINWWTPDFWTINRMITIVSYPTTPPQKKAAFAPLLKLKISGGRKDIPKHTANYVCVALEFQILGPPPRVWRGRCAETIVFFWLPPTSGLPVLTFICNQFLPWF